MQKGDLIKEVCLHLLKGDKRTCSEIVSAKYPFTNLSTEKRRPSPFLLTKIFLRDGFVDRYSGDKLLFPGILRVLKLELPEVFPAHSNWRMTETHIVYWELYPTIDHIYPIARGGKDEPENLVTTSMIRNSAKANWTLDEIGWTIKEKGEIEDWDGLTSLFLDLLKQRPELKIDKYIKTWEAALKKALTEK